MKIRKKVLLNLLAKHNHIFTKDLNELGATSAYFHKIETIPGSKPVSSQFYRASMPVQAEINRQVDEMEKSGIIKPSNSIWHSPVVLVRKKNNEFRFAVDYRRLNKIDHYSYVVSFASFRKCL